MLELFIGCVTFTPEGHDDMYYHLEMTAESYPTKEQADELKDFLQPHTVEIIDEVVFLIDATTAETIWNKEETLPTQ